MAAPVSAWKKRNDTQLAIQATKCRKLDEFTNASISTEVPESDAGAGSNIRIPASDENMDGDALSETTQVMGPAELPEEPENPVPVVPDDPENPDQIFQSGQGGEIQSETLLEEDISL